MPGRLARTRDLIAQAATDDPATVALIVRRAATQKHRTAVVTARYVERHLDLRTKEGTDHE